MTYVDDEYLRDPRVHPRPPEQACCAPSPKGGWCEAVPGHAGDHWFGLSEVWPVRPAESHAEHREGGAEGSRTSGGPVGESGRLCEQCRVPDVGHGVQTTRSYLRSALEYLHRRPGNRLSSIEATLDYALCPNMPADHTAELDQLRRAVQAVRELHQPVEGGFQWIGPMDDPANRVRRYDCSACYSPGSFDDYDTASPETWPCPTIQALDGGQR